jgi:hypothetical protein
MQAGLLPRIMAYAGEITVENLEQERSRCFREKKNINPDDTKI